MLLRFLSYRSAKQWFTIAFGWNFFDTLFNPYGALLTVDFCITTLRFPEQAGLEYGHNACRSSKGITSTFFKGSCIPLSFFPPFAFGLHTCVCTNL